MSILFFKFTSMKYHLHTSTTENLRSWGFAYNVRLANCFSKLLLTFITQLVLLEHPFHSISCTPNNHDTCHNNWGLRKQRLLFVLRISRIFLLDMICNTPKYAYVPCRIYSTSMRVCTSCFCSGWCLVLGGLGNFSSKWSKKQGIYIKRWLLWLCCVIVSLPPMNNKEPGSFGFNSDSE